MSHRQGARAPTHQPLATATETAGGAALAPGLNVELALDILAELAEAVVVLDEELRLIWANRSAEVFFGLSLPEVRGMGAIELFPDTRGGPIEAIYRRVLAGGPQEKTRLYYGTTDRWLHLRVLPWRSGLIAFYRDIDAQRRAEAELRAREDRYRAMVEHVGDVLSVSDSEGRCTWVSPSAVEVFGYERSELVGTNLRDLVTAEDLEAFDRKFQGFSPGKTMHLRQRIRHKNGDIRWVEATGQLVLGVDGTVEAIFVSRDITRAVETEAQLRAAREAAEQLAAARSAFVANMSHEIRTPLHGVLGVAGLLAGTELTVEQLRLVEIIRTSGETLLDVVNGILDLSKIEAGRLRLDIGETEICAIVEGVVEMLAASAASRQLDLYCRIDPTLPSVLSLDGLRLRQVLVNFVSNAIKFTDHGEVVLTVDRVVDAGETSLRLQVRDTGIGIDAALRPLLFQPFVQGDASTTRSRGGTGLGLSICWRLVQLMGGEITVETEVGRGSTFTVRLPLTGVDAAPGPPPTPDPALADLDVWVLSDNGGHGEAIAQTLRGLGLAATTWYSCDSTLNQEAVRHAIEDHAGTALSVIVCNSRLRPSAWQAIANSLPMPALWLIPLGCPLQPRPGDEAITRPVREHDFKAAVRRMLGSHQVTPAATHRRSTVEGPTDLAGLRVLLVEDNDINALVAELQLQRLGIVCRRVCNGAESLTALAEEPFDLALMDLQMPVLGGLEATRRLRAMPLLSQPHIVALTAGALDDDRQRALAAGMDDHLSKPTPEESLLRVLRAAAKKKQRSAASPSP